MPASNSACNRVSANCRSEMGWVLETCVAVNDDSASCKFDSCATLREVSACNRTVDLPAFMVDETALIAALEAGHIAGAGLDVFEAEPFVPPALRVMENVVILPHLGTAALEVREAMGMMALDNVIAYAEGRSLPNLI